MVLIFMLDKNKVDLSISKMNKTDNITSLLYFEINFIEIK